MLSSLCEESDVRVTGAGDALDRPSGRPPDAVGCLTVNSQPGCKLPCAYSYAGCASVGKLLNHHLVVFYIATLDATAKPPPVSLQPSEADLAVWLPVEVDLDWAVHSPADCLQRACWRVHLRKDFEAGAASGGPEPLLDVGNMFAQPISA